MLNWTLKMTTYDLKFKVLNENTVCLLWLYFTKSNATLTLSCFMMTSSNENISVLMAICARNPPVIGEYPSQRPLTRRFAVFFDLCLNKRLGEQWWGWWFETPLHPLWRHCNVRHLIPGNYYMSFVNYHVYSTKNALSFVVIDVVGVILSFTTWSILSI